MKMFSWCCLLSLFLWLTASPANANEWEATIPTSVHGLSGSCVVIPCSFSYPAHGKTYNSFTGIWYTADSTHIVYHPDASKISDIYRGRTSLTGGLRQRDCSLKISSLQDKDNKVSFMFRIEIENLDKFTYGNSKVSLTVQETPETPTVYVQEEVTSEKPVTATCGVLHSCASDLPHITWSHIGKTSGPSQPQNKGQWKLTTYNLTFTASREDHNKPLSCSAKFKEKTVTGYKKLQVKYPPYNVKVAMKSSVKENETIKLTCSSDSNPPANSYEWFSFSGTRLGNGPIHELAKVTRHTEAISCTANNTVGTNRSGPQKINVLYPPYNVMMVANSSVKENESVVLTCSSDSNPPANSYEWVNPKGTQLGHGPTYKLVSVSRTMEAITCTVKNTEGKNSSSSLKINILYPPEIRIESSCQFSGSTVCVCIVDSNPPSEVKWFGSDSSKSFTSSSIEQNKSLTTVTLRGWLGFSTSVQCFANNSLGSSSITLQANGIIIYSVVASAVVVVLLAIFVFAVRRHCKKRETEQPVMNMKNKQNELKTKSNSSKEEKAIDEAIYANTPDVCVYDNRGCNMETLPSDSALEDEAIYSNM